MGHRGGWKVAAAALSGLALASCGELGETGKAKDAVRRLLKDPDSAQFRDVQACAKPGAIQGEVNGKNSYGGYAGFEPFIYADGSAVILSERATAYDLERWEELSQKCHSDEVLRNSVRPADLDNIANGVSPEIVPGT